MTTEHDSKTDTTPTDNDAETSAQPEQETAEQEPAGKGNHEAAKYRRQARDAEAARDQAMTALNDLRLQVIEHEVGKIIVNPEVLWKLGYQITDFLDPTTGALDREMIKAKAEETRDQLGLKRKPQPMKPDFMQGASGNPHVPGDSARWTETLNNPRG